MDDQKITEYLDDLPTVVGMLLISIKSEFQHGQAAIIKLRIYSPFLHAGPCDRLLSGPLISHHLNFEPLANNEVCMKKWRDIHCETYLQKDQDKPCLPTVPQLYSLFQTFVPNNRKVECKKCSSFKLSHRRQSTLESSR